MIAGQLLIVEVGGIAFSTTPLHGRDWGISLVIGFLSIPLGVLVRLCPTAPIERFLIRVRIYPDINKLPTVSPVYEEKYQYNYALNKVKDNLSTYANIRGGRLRASSMVVKSRHQQMRDADIQLPSLLAMIPTVIAGGIGAGGNWVAPTNRLGLSDPAQDPSRSAADLYAGKGAVASGDRP